MKKINYILVILLIVLTILYSFTKHDVIHQKAINANITRLTNVEYIYNQSNISIGFDLSLKEAFDQGIKQENYIIDYSVKVKIPDLNYEKVYDYSIYNTKRISIKLPYENNKDFIIKTYQDEPINVYLEYYKKDDLDCEPFFTIESLDIFKRVD